jgi:gliding motility-associated-like protein
LIKIDSFVKYPGMNILNRKRPINMNKVKLISRLALVWVFLALAFVNKAQAQCAIVSKAEGCVGASILFTATGPDASGYDSIEWLNSKSVATRAITNPAGFVWAAATGGATTVTLNIYKGGVIKCSSTHNITIYDNPIADFKLLSPTPQCFNGNSFKFQDITQTPSGNPIVWREFVYGDGGAQNDSVPNPIPTVIGGAGGYSYTPPTAAGGNFDPIMRVRDSKGCISFIQKVAFIGIKPDLGVDFTPAGPKKCGSTPIKFTNTSLISQGNAKSFKWEFGDGTSDSGTWDNFTHVYTKDGCFNASLIVQSNDGCFDTAKKQAGCNIAPVLDVSVKNGDVQCAGDQKFIFVHPTIQGATFNWNFDDIPSGNLNNDNKNWTTGHDFTGTGPYDVTFTLITQGCRFDTVYRVHVKGPGAAIESKPNTVIPASQRYQCKIHDTVYFTNVSSYYFNDDSAYNDFYYTVKGAIFQFINMDSAHIDFDTIYLKKGIKQKFTTRSGRNVYVSPAGDTVAIGSDTLILQGNYLVKGTKLSDRDPFQNNGKHVDRYWDFGDQIAPTCTTDSRPIYPKSAANGNLHWPTSPAPAWTYDANGKWYNCNFNRDSLPKHWYTPGQEQCYTVTLHLKDTSKSDPNIESLTASHNDPSGIKACESTSTVNLALQGPDANGLRWEGIPCYGPPTVYGFIYKFDKTKPSCDREFFWIHLDSLADRVDNTPNVFDKWIPQTGTVVDRNFTPWPMATLGLPPNVGEIFWQYSANGTYPSKIADKAGWVTLGFRVQNGVDPLTGQPCIDEVWYDSAYRYINSNPAFKFYNANKPDSFYTFERTCTPTDVLIKRDSTYLPATNTFTYSSDSIGAEIWNWGDGEIEIDSFVRYNQVGSQLLSYRIRYKISGTAAPIKTDSVITRIVDANTKQVLFVDARDTTPDIYRTHRFTNAAWNLIGHTIIPCQKLPIDSLGFTVFRKQCCDNPPFQQSNVAITGFFSELNSSDSIVCRNTPIQFFDSARYYLEFPIPFPPYIIDAYDYWLDPRTDPAGNFRKQPRPFPADYEKLRWDFGDGSGWNSSVPDNPTRSFPDPGVYDVKLEYSDSFGCKQVLVKKIKVTGISANFSFDRNINSCIPTVKFLDSALLLDPCVLTDGTNCDQIISWFWDFGDNKPNNQSISALPNPSKVYTTFGDFDVTLVVKTKLGCVDSIKRTISLEGPRPRFEFAADTVGCVPFTVELRNTSINPTKGANWTWFMGDGTQVDRNYGQKDSILKYTYNTPGTYEIFLLQNDSVPLNAGGALCPALFPDTLKTFGTYRKYIVRVLPSRKASFTLSDSIVCVGDSVSYFSNSDSIYTTFKWITGVGDTIIKAKTAGGDTTGKKYETPGTFFVQLRPSYTPPPGDPACPTSAVQRVYVRDVKAILTCDTLNPPVVEFKNTSRNMKDFWWDFGDGNGFVSGHGLPKDPDASYNYGEKRGEYYIFLAVESPEGCKDTTYCYFNNHYEVFINPFNVFTPGDGNTINDFFKVDVENEESYQLAIYNRWGEKVFEADNKDDLWNGNHMNTGPACPAGVYFVVINYRLRGEDDKIYHGTLTLIK